MSRQYLELLLQELKKVRIACKGQRDGKPCGAVIEVEMANLHGFFPANQCKCPWCGQSFYPANEGFVENPFNPLAEAIRNLAAIQDKVSVTLVIDAVGVAGK